MNNSNQILVQTFLNSLLLQEVDYQLDTDLSADIVEKAKRFVVFKNRESSVTEVKSIFSIVDDTIDDFMPMKPLTIAANCFPNEAVVKKEVFLQKIQSIVAQEKDENRLAEKLFYTFKQNAWSLKSEKGQDYLSEFEYLKSQTAFTICLNQHDNNNPYPFLLFCADISGIQDFIYSIHSKKASKSLKGRSFYLQLMMNSILEQYIKATNTSICNIIYSSGGKFFMLLPNTLEVKKALQDLELSITKELYEQHKETLSIMTAYVPFAIKDSYAIEADKTECTEEVENLKQLWKAVSQKVSKKKQTKLSSLFEDSFDLFFEGKMDTEYNDNRYTPCAVTGRPTKKIQQNEINSFDEDKEYVTPLVQQQIKLGEDLRDANFINFGKSDFKLFKNALGVEISEKAGANSILINPESDTKGQPFLFYGGNKQALNGKEVKTFEELTIPDDNEKKFNKLGVLRMDVDDLGHLFTGKERSNETVTFATYSTLSAALDWFFSGYLNTLRNSTKYSDYVNIIYAGGDDLFAVGRWDKLIDFAIDVRNEFRKYTGGNDVLKLSAGLAVVNNKFPISKAASMAGEALEAAKKYRTNEKGNGAYDKNAFHLFGQSVSWAEGANDEMKFVIELSNILSIHLKNNTLSSGYFYNLYQYKTLKDTGELSWYWQSAYSTGRYIERLDKKYVDEKALLKAIQLAIISKHFEYKNIKITVNGYGTGRVLDLICLAAQLADYYNR